MRILRINDVLDRTGIGAKSTLYKYIKDGSFPQPIKIGPKASGWREDEVDQWIAARTAERDQHAA